MPFRYDKSEIETVIRREDGSLVARAVPISRAGVFVYQDADGTVRRELRPPEEVWDDDALASFENIPVTLGHPPGEVTPENYQEHAVGQTGDRVFPDWKSDQLVVVSSSVTLTRQDALEAFDAGTRELSCGYKVKRIREESGEWNGQRYDFVQEGIRGNHVALVDRGRAGSVASLRADSAVQVEPPKEEEPNPMAKIKVDGQDVEVPDASAAAITAALDRRDGEIAGLKATLENRPNVEEEIARRQDALEEVKHLLPADYDAKGKDVSTIRRDALTHKMGDEVKEWSEEMVRGALSALKATSAGDGVAQARADALTPTQRQDDDAPRMTAAAFNAASANRTYNGGKR